MFQYLHIRLSPAGYILPREERVMNIEAVQRLVGPVTEKQIELVDCYPWKRSGVFIPAAGQCGYAVTRDHTHPSYSFILYSGDTFAVSIEGKEIESSTREPLIMAFGPTVYHHEIQREQFTRYYAIFIECALFESIWKNYTDQAVPPFRGDQYRESIDLIPHIKSYICEHADNLPGRESQLDGLEIRLVHLIIRTILPLHNSSERIAQRFEVARACELISEKYGERLSLKQVADMIHLSPSHFSQIFRKETGKTVNEFILEVRMKSAKRLLEQGKESLTEISYRCGFSSPSHFSTAFRSYFGEKPSTYQKMFSR